MFKHTVHLETKQTGSNVHFKHLKTLASHCAVMVFTLYDVWCNGMYIDKEYMIVSQGCCTLPSQSHIEMQTVYLFILYFILWCYCSSNKVIFPPEPGSIRMTWFSKLKVSIAVEDCVRILYLVKMSKCSISELSDCTSAETWNEETYCSYFILVRAFCFLLVNFYWIICLCGVKMIHRTDAAVFTLLFQVFQSLSDSVKCLW